MPESTTIVSVNQPTIIQTSESEAQLTVASPGPQGTIDSLTFSLPTPTGSEAFPFYHSKSGRTATKATVTLLGGTSPTLTCQVQKRAAASLNSVGTNMLSSSLVGTQAGASTTSFASASIAAGDHLVLITSAIGGSPTHAVIRIDF